MLETFDGDDDPQVRATLKAEVERHKQVKADLARERAELATKIEQVTLPPQEIESIVEFARLVNKRMGRASWAGKRRLLQVLNVRVRVVYTEKGRELHMECDIPGAGHAELLDEKQPKSFTGFYSSNRNVASP